SGCSPFLHLAKSRGTLMAGYSG
ncbi:ABC transporter, periplasmic substrate-binding domain protein, partial [Vibrio parahaemolyticus V-223/04]